MLKNISGNKESIIDTWHNVGKLKNLEKRIKKYNYTKDNGDTEGY